MGATFAHETYLSSNKDHQDGYQYWARFEDDFFGQGVSRLAFKGTLHGKGPQNNYPCVTKVFKRHIARKFEKWVPDLLASKTADHFAQMFNKNQLPRLRNYCRDAKPIEYTIPLIAQMDQISHFKLLGIFTVGADTTYVDPQEYVALEPFLEGKYEKFNSNGGWEQNDYVADLMNTFSHWTWQKSGHKFMVCDIQGVLRKDKYVLTDPAVHSAEILFGSTDLGVYGMELVLANHKCNCFCRELGLCNPMTGVNMQYGHRPTTYAFQLTEEEQLRRVKERSPFFNNRMVPEE